MIDGLTNVLHPEDRAKWDAEQTLESIAIAGASAIQRLISERDNLRVRVNTQQGELANLTAANVELRRCMLSIRRHYIELATKILTQLEQYDQIGRDLIQERQGMSLDGREEDANLVSLAHRLKPATTSRTSVANFDGY